MSELNHNLHETPALEKPIDIESAYKRALEYIESNALKIESFATNPANTREVKNDARYVENRKRNFSNSEQPEYKLAKCLEAVFCDRTNSAEWFGKNARMVMPTEYDDLHNGIDGVVEFPGKQGKKYLGLALDVTYQHDPSKKFKIIREQIERGDLGKVKYFRSSDGSFEGSLDHLPRVVVMMNAADTTRVVRDWQEGKTENDNLYRDLVLYQIFLQLKFFKEYVLGKPELKHLAVHYEGALNNVGALLAMIFDAQKLKELNAHPTIKIIYGQLQNFKSEVKG